jgi:acetyl-CoA carboxylase biotin carboxyl carrier protein
MTDDTTRAPGSEPAARGAAVGPLALAGAAQAAPAGDGPPPGGALPAGDLSLLALVERLAGLLERSDLLELEVEAGETGIILRKAAALGPLPASAILAPAAVGTPAASGPAAAAPTLTPAPAAPPSGPARSAVLAPLTGIFYASPSPGSAPFVDVGREVAVGQVIGLIEAMKLFNEIKSDKAGRVVRVVAESGTLVKAKHPLIEVEPL